MSIKILSHSLIIYIGYTVLAFQEVRLLKIYSANIASID